MNLSFCVFFFGTHIVNYIASFWWIYRCLLRPFYFILIVELYCGLANTHVNVQVNAERFNPLAEDPPEVGAVPWEAHLRPAPLGAWLPLHLAGVWSTAQPAQD